MTRCAKNILLVFFISAAMVACAATRSSNFYMLDTIEPQKVPGSTKESLSSISIGVGPFIFPDYLDRSQIVTRTSPNEVTISEFDRWAEPINENFLRVLAENLSLLLGTNQVEVFPWQTSSKKDYRITGDVVRFDGSLTGQAFLIVRWSILDNEGKTLITGRKSSYHAPVPNPHYGALVRTQNALVLAFSKEIAAAIDDLFQKVSGRQK